MLVDDATKARASSVVRRAIRDRLLSNPQCCELCGKQGYVVGHHDDYSEPLSVRWLCQSCHSGLDTPVHKPNVGNTLQNNNCHKQARNAEIVRLFDEGRGLTHREIAERMGMKTAAVSMVIMRAKRKEN